MSVLIFFLLLPLAEAQTIKPECSAAEIEILRSEKIRTQFIWDRSLNSIDCFYVQKSETERLIWFLVVTNTSAGLESYLALFDGKGFSESSLAIFKSRPLGFDLFPISVNGQFRLGFVHPKSTLNKLSLFINAQTSPGTSRLVQFDYNYATKSLQEINARSWPIEAGLVPKLYEDQGVWRALLSARSVELF